MNSKPIPCPIKKGRGKSSQAIRGILRMSELINVEIVFSDHTLRTYGISEMPAMTQ